MKNNRVEIVHQSPDIYRVSVPSDADLFLTHLHSDHTGLSELFVNENHRIYMGEKEYAF